MKYVLYIDYRASYKPLCSEYKPLEAKNIKEAIIEADALSVRTSASCPTPINFKRK